ncbi:MAG: M48 family metallopeptidase, partial [Planctomycetes bacterium]|nr:M48 family metallopeptidase [Planctomycetota bacterium]
VWGCRSVPVTGRKQVLLVPESQEIAMGETAYQEILQEQPLSKDARAAAVVERVGRRIAAVADRPDYQWEFRVLASDVPNAFCLPGGKVAFYEGILPICQNEAGVAAVMSHEIAHALARHGGERISQGLIAQAVGQVIRLGLGEKDDVERERILWAYGIVSQYGVILPYSRKHEAEADAIGLKLMARAGYDPTEAVRFWERFAAAAAGPRPPEFLSTHPSDERRAEALRRLLPEALELYAQAETQFGLGERLLADETRLAGHQRESTR